MLTKQAIVKNVNLPLNKMLNMVKEDFFTTIEEIRIRINKPIIIKANNKEYFLCDKGISVNKKDAYISNKDDLEKTVEIMCNRSYYTIREQIKKGYITLDGGHRVGITGTVVSNEDKVVMLKNITSLNIRVSKEIKGCSNKIMPIILKEGFGHTLIVSSPGCGKTTLLRDIIKNISNNKLTVGVVDERCEISSSFKGIPQIDLGERTDILENCPKHLGMIMLLRSMSPQVIAVDEIGTKKDIESIEMILNAGVKILATVHSKNFEELKNKPDFKFLLQNKVFDTYIILDNIKKVGNIAGIYNKDFEKMWGE